MSCRSILGSYYERIEAEKERAEEILSTEKDSQRDMIQEKIEEISAALWRCRDVVILEKVWKTIPQLMNVT